eukprot:CAMPEP_0116561128 /NCGR_PEP_ID=MMETSP0397-20121206/11399_1 /TAXON_ID=216820 /ORGANISM="Cyclophora tenuis, Strain ECT3854" /LENGTH=116 /DNA_ID=CAMNT_0004087213 /DNA_START=175 /DNA_END=525 /DNA_ORIENTATION=+
MSSSMVHLDNQHDDSDELYGDLDEAYTPPISKNKNNSNSSINTNVSKLQDEVRLLRNQVSSLQQENEVLKRNMGTLFRTARAEIRRKDLRIEELERMDYSAYMLQKKRSSEQEIRR